VEHREPEPETADSGGGPAVEAEPVARRRPSTMGGAFYLLVVAASAVGLGIVGRGNWRLGVKWIAAALVVSALVRLVLPVRDAGMLAVRRRWVDVLLLALVGVALWFLSSTIPNQPPL
jgi:Protein of unknown function (DUF3017)